MAKFVRAIGNLFVGIPVPIEDDFSSELKYSKDDGWICHVGLKSGCGPSLLSYLEQTIRREYGPVFY